MMLYKIAVTHPGKMGDAIYSLPTIRWLCNKYNMQADFWTSSYCQPLKRLFEYQSCISEFHVSPRHVIQHKNMGVQPWLVPVSIPGNYQQIFHLGFRGFPKKLSIIDFTAQVVGAPKGLPLYYEYPDIPTLDQDYLVVAPRGERYWEDLMKEVVNNCKAVIVQVGGPKDKVSDIGIDKTGMDFLETVSWIAKAKAFAGCQSSQLVLAEGFKNPHFLKRSGHNMNDVISIFKKISIL